jgi:uncharacterized RDD family membrane protein YckC
MLPSAPFAGALFASSALPTGLRGLDENPLWAALFTSVQNVVLGEIAAARYPGLADETLREGEWPALLEALAQDARARIGSEVFDALTVDTVDELWVEWMRVATPATRVALPPSMAPTADPEALAAASTDPGVQERSIELLEVIGEVVDKQLADRFGISEGLPTAPTAIRAFTAPAEPTGPEPAAWMPSEAPSAEATPAWQPEHPVRPASAQPTSAQPAQTPSYFDPSALASPEAAPSQAAPPQSPPPPYPAPNSYAVPPGDPGWRPLPPVRANAVPAPLGRRAAAFLIDRAIVILLATVASLALLWPATSAATGNAGPASATPLMVLALLGVLLMMLAYFVVVAWLVGKKGASPGKRLMGLEVTGFASPGPIGFGRALLRELILYAFGIGSILTVWLPYASVFWDSSKQLRGWHDKAVDDIVVLKQTL